MTADIRYRIALDCQNMHGIPRVQQRHLAKHVKKGEVLICRHCGQQMYMANGSYYHVALARIGESQ